MSQIQLRRFRGEDLPRIQDIRKAAFAPVFASFETILGKGLSQIIPNTDDGQRRYLDELAEDAAGHELYVVLWQDRIAGFLDLRLEHEAIGEIGLNAVDPQMQGRGIGTEMYRFAIERFREAGKTGVFVGTGGDESHAPARRAYAKAGLTIPLPTVTLYREL
jgi:GNAT superfamily N-acetyltransferase